MPYRPLARFFQGRVATAPYSAEINSANNARHTEAKMSASDDEREEDPRHASPRLVAASHRAIR